MWFVLEFRDVHAISVWETARASLCVGGQQVTHTEATQPRHTSNTIANSLPVDTTFKSKYGVRQPFYHRGQSKPATQLGGGAFTRAQQPIRMRPAYIPWQQAWATVYGHEVAGTDHGRAEQRASQLPGDKVAHFSPWQFMFPPNGGELLTQRPKPSCDDINRKAWQVKPARNQASQQHDILQRKVHPLLRLRPLQCL